jgi:hypothetical protein
MFDYLTSVLIPAGVLYIYMYVCSVSYAYWSTEVVRFMCYSDETAKANYSNSGGSKNFEKKGRSRKMEPTPEIKKKGIENKRSNKIGYYGCQIVNFTNI